MRSTRSLGPKHCQLPTIVRRVVLSTVTRVFKKRSISQSRELKPLEGNFHFKTLMGTTFSHEKSLQSVLVHRGCHEHFRTQALSIYYTGAQEQGRPKALELTKVKYFMKNLLKGISISRLSWAPLFLMRSHCKAFLFIGDVMSISEHKLEHIQQGCKNRGDQKPWSLPNSSIS